jgi:LemA protein
MKKYTVIGLLLVVVLIGGWLLSSYNSIVKGNLQVDAQWAQVETVYQRRFDLIPNLVNSVQGIFKQEKDVFGAIAQARQGYAGARTIDEKAQAASQVESALGRLLVITENYPQLQSNQALMGLMTQLEGTENRVSVERTRYNDAVNAFNGSIITFPSSVVARLFGFKERTFFKAEVDAAKAPVVNFNQQ